MPLSNPHHKLLHHSVFPALLVLCCMPLMAQAAKELSFQHGDWEVVCDNTRTCRIAGYQEDAANMPVSVLFTRKAGAGTPVSGQVTFGEDWSSTHPTAPTPSKLTLYINQRAQGLVSLSGDNATANLSSTQVAALLKALLRDSQIEFRAQKQVFVLSDTGASAVLLKMDEFQGRVGTVGALHRKGSAPETKVTPPLPAPVVRAVTPHKSLPGDVRLFEQLNNGKQSDALRTELQASSKEEPCDDLEQPQTDEPVSLEFERLSKNKLLVSTRCWLAAYNSGSGYWVINQKPPYRPVLVTTMGNEYETGVIGARHKGRGIGDCWGGDEWTWNGSSFVQTESMSTGMCRGFPGGAWELPTLATEVKKSN